MDAGPSRWCSPMKMSKKIRIGGVPTPSVGKNFGKLRANGCGTCASHWDRGCREASYATPSWAPPKEAPPFVVAAENPPEEYGPWQWAAQFGRATGRIASRYLRLTRERETALPGRGKPVVERSASRECVYESVPSTWPTRPIVCHVLSESSV